MSGYPSSVLFSFLFRSVKLTYIWHLGQTLFWVARDTVNAAHLRPFESKAVSKRNEWDGTVCLLLMFLCGTFRYGRDKHPQSRIPEYDRFDRNLHKWVHAAPTRAIPPWSHLLRLYWWWYQGNIISKLTVPRKVLMLIFSGFFPWPWPMTSG